MPFVNAGAAEPTSRHISLGFCLLLLAFINSYAQKPELIAQVGHTQAPHWLKFGLQGRILISAGDDHLITIWDVEQRRLLLTTRWVSVGGPSLDDNGGAFSFNLDGTVMAVRTSMDTLRVWNLVTGQVTHSFKTPVQEACSRYEEISVSDDGKFLSRVFADSCGEQQTDDYQLQVWNLVDGRDRTFPLGKFKQASAEFSPDGRRFILVDSPGANQNRGDVWDIISGSKLYQIQNRGLRISGEPRHFSHDGQLLFVIDGDTLQVREAATGNPLLSLPALNGKLERIEMIEASDDHRVLATIVRTQGTKVGDSHKLKLWQIPDGKTLRTLEISVSHFDASALVFSPDSQSLFCRVGALEETRLKAWNVATGSERFTSKIDNYTNLVLSQDGRLLAVGDRDSGIDLSNAGDGLKMQTLSGHETRVASIEFSLDGKNLITDSIGSDNSSKSRNRGIWNLSAGDFKRSLPGNFVGSSQDGKRILTREAPNTQTAGPAEQAKPEAESYTLTIWDAETGDKLETFEGDIVGYPVNGRVVIQFKTGAGIIDLNSGRLTAKLPVSGTLSPNGKLLASTISDDGTSKIYSVPDGRIRSSLKWRRDPENEGFSFLTDLVFSPDSRYLASSINLKETNVIEVRSVTTGKLWQSLDVNSYQSADYHFDFAFSADGKTLVVADDLPQVWDLTTGKQKLIAGSFGLPADRLRYSDSVRFSPNEKYLVHTSIGESGGRLRLWQVSHKGGLSLHPKAVYDGSAAAFSEDDRVLATVSDDQMVKLWDVASGKFLGSLVPFEKDNWLVIAPDGRFDGTPAAWNRIFWRFPESLLDSAPIEVFFNEFYYPGLLADIFSNKLPPLNMTMGEKDRRQPRLELSYPGQESSQARAATIRLSVTEASADKKKPNNGSGAQDVRLFRNGSLVKVWRGDVLKGQSSVTLEATVPIVAGANKFTAYAFNRDNIKSGDATLTVTGAEALKRSGTAYVLAVGINSYSNPAYDL